MLIDPPYEIKSDYQAVVTGIHEGYKRFATGTYALWYPVVLRAQIKRMIKELEATGIRKILQIELAVRPDSDQRGMTARDDRHQPAVEAGAAAEQRSAVAA